MPTRLRNACLILGMVALLVFAKYRIARLTVVTPFNQDPCDAVWAFAFTTIMLIAVVSGVRAFRSYRDGSASAAQGLFIIRSQQAFALAVFMTFVADVIALARHPSMWITAASRNKLLAWLGVFAAVALATQLSIVAARRTLHLDALTRWKRSALALAAAIVLLVSCPEWPSDNSSQTAHILTVALGGLVIFVPMRFLLPAVAPYGSNEEHGRWALSRAVSDWIALLVGIPLFALGFWADTHRWEGTLRHLRPVVMTAPLLISYAFLAGPLGLVPWEKRQIARGL